MVLLVKAPPTVKNDAADSRSLLLALMLLPPSGFEQAAQVCGHSWSRCTLHPTSCSAHAAGSRVHTPSGD